jgi:hypothetical protein
MNRRALFTGRRKPYTLIGIRRKRCVRCGASARFQWSACANGNRWVPLCLECDVAVNAIVLDFLKLPNAGELLKQYDANARRDFPNMGD